MSGVTGLAAGALRARAARARLLCLRAWAVPPPSLFLASKPLTCKNRRPLCPGAKASAVRGRMPEDRVLTVRGLTRTQIVPRRSELGRRTTPRPSCVSDLKEIRQQRVSAKLALPLRLFRVQPGRRSPGGKPVWQPHGRARPSGGGRDRTAPEPSAAPASCACSRGAGRSVTTAAGSNLTLHSRLAARRGRDGDGSQAPRPPPERLGYDGRRRQLFSLPTGALGVGVQASDG